MAESQRAEAGPQSAPERVERTRELNGQVPAVQLQRALASSFQGGRIDPRGLTPRAVLALQRTAGNAAVNQLLQQKASSGPRLDESKTQAALAWGESEDNIGTEAVNALQIKLKMPNPSGRYDRDTVLAVAQWQHTNKRPITGKAGPDAFLELGLIFTKKINAAKLSSDDILTELETQGGVTIAVYAELLQGGTKKLKEQGQFFKKVAAEHAKRFSALGLSGTAIQKGLAMSVSGADEVIEKVLSIEKGLTGRYLEKNPTSKDTPAYLRVKNLAVFSHGEEYGLGLDPYNSFNPAVGGLTKTNLKAFAQGLKSALASDVRVQLYACSTAGAGVENNDGKGGKKEPHSDSFAAHLAKDLGENASVYGHEVEGQATDNPRARVLGKDAGSAGAEGLSLFDMMFPNDYQTAELARLFPDDDRREARRKKLAAQMHNCYVDCIRGTVVGKDKSSGESILKFLVPMKKGTPDIGDEMFAKPDNARKLFQDHWRTKWLAISANLRAITPDRAWKPHEERLAPFGELAGKGGITGSLSGLGR